MKGTSTRKAVVQGIVAVGILLSLLFAGAAPSGSKRTDAINLPAIPSSLVSQ